MGNVCPCFGGSESAPKPEYTPVPTSEPTTTRQPEKVNEKSTSNYQTIVENATNEFLFTKPKYKESTSSEGVDAIRNRLQTAKVDSKVEYSPIIIRPTPGDNDKQAVLKILSSSGKGNNNNKGIDNKASEIVRVLQKTEENVISYQNDNLPLVSFSTNEK